MNIMQAEAAFEDARLIAQGASRELDESQQWSYFDPERFANAQQAARSAFKNLHVAARDVYVARAA